jgi:hypothetical protein
LNIFFFLRIEEETIRRQVQIEIHCSVCVGLELKSLCARLYGGQKRRSRTCSALCTAGKRVPRQQQRKTSAKATKTKKIRRTKRAQPLTALLTFTPRCAQYHAAPCKSANERQKSAARRIRTRDHTCGVH